MKQSNPYQPTESASDDEPKEDRKVLLLGGAICLGVAFSVLTALALASRVVSNASNTKTLEVVLDAVRITFNVAAFLSFGSAVAFWYRRERLGRLLLAAPLLLLIAMVLGWLL